MKNKKILGALAALCMGIILCVSSVFAINYWYNINNDGAANNTVTMGNALNLTLTDALSEEEFLYPGGTVKFLNVTVAGADDWKVGEGTNVNNVARPKFALRVASVTATGDAMTTPEAIATFGKLFTVYSNHGNGNFVKVVADTVEDEVTTVNSLLAKDLLILDDLQVACDTDNVFDILLAFDAEASAIYANAELTFTLEIVAYIGPDYASALANVDGAKILSADQDTAKPGTNPNNGDPAVDVNDATYTN